MADNDLVICTESPDVCQNGGNCVVVSDARDNYCDCPTNTNGNRCHQVIGGFPSDISDNDVVVCTESPDVCQNGGNCIVLSDARDNYCNCPTNTDGNRCHQVLSSGSGSDELTESEQAAAEAAFAEAAADETICTEDGGQCQNGGFCVMATMDGQVLKNYCVCPPTNQGNRCHGTNPDTSLSSEVCTEDGSECINGSTCTLQDLDKEIPFNHCTCINGFFGVVCGEKHPTSPPKATTGDSGSGNTGTCTTGGMECVNGGVCVLTSDQIDMSEGNYCSCPEGTSGDRCENEDICDLDCQHGASCRHYEDIAHNNGSGSTSFYCECTGNYKGMECEIPFTTCPLSGITGDQLVCLYGGQCVAFDESSDEYKCDCPNGRSGKNCETGVVSTIEDYNGLCYQNEDCFNGGLCTRTHDFKATKETGMETKATQCLCSLGWGGDNCEFQCKTLNCQHGSSCRFPSADDITHTNDSPEDGAFCECPDNYKGQECEIAVQTCPGIDKIECLYGGQCIGSLEDGDADVYHCACPAGRLGARCETIDSNYKPSKGGDSSLTVMKPTSTPLKVGPNVIIVTMSVLVFLLAIPFMLLLCRRNRLRKNAAIAQASASECLDDGFSATTESTDSKVNGNGHSNGALGNGNGEDVFYDTDGVVNVNLDENEPVLLSKDKQIV